jgi:hypothetical protein
MLENARAKKADRSKTQRLQTKNSETGKNGGASNRYSISGGKSGAQVGNGDSAQRNFNGQGLNEAGVKTEKTSAGQAEGLSVFAGNPANGANSYNNINADDLYAQKTDNGFMYEYDYRGNNEGQSVTNDNHDGFADGAISSDVGRDADAAENGLPPAATGAAQNEIKRDGAGFVRAHDFTAMIAGYTGGPVRLYTNGYGQNEIYGNDDLFAQHLKTTGAQASENMPGEIIGGAAQAGLNQQDGSFFTFGAGFNEYMAAYNATAANAVANAEREADLSDEAYAYGLYADGDEAAGGAGSVSAGGAAPGGAADAAGGAGGSLAGGRGFGAQAAGAAAPGAGGGQSGAAQAGAGQGGWQGAGYGAENGAGFSGGASGDANGVFTASALYGAADGAGGQSGGGAQTGGQGAAHGDGAQSHAGRLAAQAETVYEMLNNVPREAKLMLNGSKYEFAMQLKPESLGKVTMRLAMDGGIVNARFLVDSEQARRQIEANLEQLRQSLAEQGLQINGFSVDIRQEGDGAYGRWEPGGDAGRRRREGGGVAGYDAGRVVRADAKIRAFLLDSYYEEQSSIQFTA